MKTTYRGFSSYSNNQSPIDNRMVDRALIKQDLINHFNTFRGEVLGRASFGSNLRSRLGEPFDEITKANIINDVTMVVRYDPRVSLKSVVPEYTDDTIVIVVVLEYVNDNEVDLINLFVDRNGVS